LANPAEVGHRAISDVVSIGKAKTPSR